MILRTLAAAALALTLIGATHPANAIVTRHDTPDARYLADEHAFPPLADLPGEGHGVLIAPQWVLTVAHAVYDQRDSLDAITIAGQSRAVAEVIVHPEFEPLPADAMSGDAAPLMARLGELRDIALIRLAEPVNDVAPVTLYRGANEAGRLVRIIGRGATANGLTGEAPDTPHRGALRRAYNRIDIAEGRWLAYSFDQGRAAHRREAMQGSGDSGGPVLMRDGGRWTLVGLASWRSWQGDLANFRAGIYGQSGYQTRVSFYADWIDSVIAARR